MYKLVIFDFDGTLVDSIPGVVAVMRTVASQCNFAQETLDKWIQLVGVPLAQQMEILFPGKSPEYKLSIENKYREIYDHKALEICPLFPELKEVLEQLNSAGILMSIASSKIRALVEVVLEHYSISHYFALVVGAQDVSKHKPDREAVDRTIANLKVPRGNVIVVGDTTFDLDMARNAGVDSIGITTGVHTARELQESSPRYVVSSLNEALPLILNGRLR